MTTRENYDQWDRAVIGLALLVAFAFFAAATLHPFEEDVGIYHTYGLSLLHGSRHGRLPVEYPAAAAFLFAFPLLVHLPYALGFALLMAVALVVLAVAGWRLGADAAWLNRTVLYLALSTGAVLFGRYDLAPALATFLAVMYARRHRWSAAWIAAAVGGLLKLFPFLLLPGFLLVEWRETGRLPMRRLATSVVALTAISGIQTVLAPGSLLSPIRYEWLRGFELSSVGGSITTLIDPLHLHWQLAFENWEIVGSGHAAIQVLLGLAAVLGVLAVWALTWRRGLAVEVASLAVLSIAVLTDRALAPQYLIWLAPLWALWSRRRLWMAAAALTTLTFPVAYGFAQPDGHGFMLATVIALVRNAALVAGTGLWFAQQLKPAYARAVYQGDASNQHCWAACTFEADGTVAVSSLGATRRLSEARPGEDLDRLIGGGATSPGDGG